MARDDSSDTRAGEHYRSKNRVEAEIDEEDEAAAGGRRHRDRRKFPREDNVFETDLKSMVLDAGKAPPDRAKEKSGKSDKSEKDGKASETRPEVEEDQDAESEKTGTSWFGRLGSLTSSALNLARKTTDGSMRVGRTILKSQDQLRVMLAAGQSLRDVREVAGLTLSELSDALNLKDKTLLEAVENGTATLSFELILRLAALLARNDPVPFILKFTRSYNPEVWRVLSDWGLGRLPLHYEREREFINIYRRHDAARQLSDEGFAKVLGFTRHSFEMALHFVAEQEQISLVKVREAEERIKSETAAEAEQAAAAEGDKASQPAKRRFTPDFSALRDRVTKRATSKRPESTKPVKDTPGKAPNHGGQRDKK